MYARGAVLLTLALTLGSGPLWAATVSTYEEALQAAAAAEDIAILDFFTTWCGPCKTFDKDLEEDADLAGFVEGVALVRIDAGAVENAPLTQRHEIHAYPTFVAVDSRGEELYRWMGYTGPEQFIREVETARNHPVTIADRIAAFEARPSADDAAEIAGLLDRGGRFAEAAVFHEHVAELDPERAAPAQWDAFEASRRSCEFYLPIPWSLMERRARAVLADPDIEGGRILRVAVGMRAAAKLERDLILYLPYLQPALTAQLDPDDRHAAFYRPLLEWDRRILSEQDVDGAIRDRRAELPQGWEADVYKVIGYTMWCAEHAADLPFAQQTVETAIEDGIASDRDGETFLWSNLADIHFAAGNIDQAISAQKRAIGLSPQYAPLRMILEYFESIAAQDS